MEATTVLFLILLANAGARDIPASDLSPQALFKDENHRRAIESEVSSAKAELPSNTNVSESEKNEGTSASLLDGTSDTTNYLDDEKRIIWMTKNARDEEIKKDWAMKTLLEGDIMKRIVKVTAPEDTKTEDEFIYWLQNRLALKGDYCPDGTRVGNECWDEQ